MDGDKVIVPETFLASNVKYYTANGNPLTAAEYQQFNPPTLAELGHAFFDKNPDESFVCPIIRRSVRLNGGYGEWTSTFLRGGSEVVERPEIIHHDQKHELWLAEGGKVSRVELPPRGWTTEYDRPTGIPSKTSSERKYAERVFGGDTSYFYAARNGLHVVLRSFHLHASGPFFVHAAFEPGYWEPSVGVRSLRRSEQYAECPATPMYLMGQPEYEELIKLSEGDEKIGAIVSRIRIQLQE